MLSTDIPISKLGWVLGDSRERHALYFEYSLANGPTKSYNGSIDIREEQSLKHFFSWILENIEPSRPYKILGKTINPHYEIYEIRHAVVGGPFNIPSGQYIVTFETVHPSEKEHGPSKSYKETDFPVEIREFLNSINESLWNRVRHDLVQRFKLSSDEIPIYLEKHVFLVYKATNATSKQVAEKLGKFLQDKKMRVWYFPRKVGWGDSLTGREEEAIDNSFGAVLCITTDFFEGATVKEEYRALSAKRRRDSSFKLGYLLVGCNHDVVPPFMRDYFGVAIETADDSNFEKEAEKIYRGLLGLPLETPE